MRRLFFCAACIAPILFGARGEAAVLLNVGGPFKAQAEPREFLFEVPAAVKAALLEVSVAVSDGKATIRVKDPSGKEIYSSSCKGTMAIGAQPLKTPEAGMYRLELINESGSANWAVKISTGAERAFLEQNLASGIGMLVVAIFAVLAWRSGAHARWRWFGVGAALWIVGVALKFAWAIPLNPMILKSLKGAMPHDAYLIVGSIYVGLLTGVFEIGITLLAALIWKQMARDAARGVAVGVGAGAFEALLLGIAAVATALTALLNPSSDVAAAMGGAASVASMTPLFWMVGTVERVIAILCHTSSRTLVLYGVARGRWWPFIGGFVLMTAVDAVAGYAILSEIAGRVNIWWIELAVAPFALISIPIVVWCVRNWPTVAAPVAAE